MKENGPQDRSVDIERVLSDISEKYKGILDECESIGYHKAWWHQKILELKNLVKDFIHQTKIAEPKLPPSYYMSLDDFIRSTEARDLIEKLTEGYLRGSISFDYDENIGIHSRLLLGLKAPLKDFELIIDWYRSGDKADSDDSVPISENSPTKDDPRRWFTRLPKDKLKALLGKRISEGEGIKSSFEPRPFPQPTTRIGTPPKVGISNSGPPPPGPYKKGVSRGRISKAPEKDTKHEPKDLMSSRLSSVEDWQTEFSSWDNFNYSILERGYYSRKAYRDYLPGTIVSRIHHYPATKELELGDIMTEWIISFMRAYDRKNTQLKKYLHELEYYKYERGTVAPVGKTRKKKSRSRTGHIRPETVERNKYVVRMMVEAKEELGKSIRRGKPRLEKDIYPRTIRKCEARYGNLTPRILRDIYAWAKKIRLFPKI